MKKILNLKFLIILMVLLIFVYTIVSQEMKLRDQQAERIRLEEINDDLVKECLYYEKEKDNINEDEQITKQMREKLRFIKNGEIMVIDRNQREK